MGIKTGADLKKVDKSKLVTLFGKVGEHYYGIVHGEDDRPVNPYRIRKSIGKETTLSEDIDSKEQMIAILNQLALEVEELLKKHNVKGRTITLKIKYFDFQNITRSITAEKPVVLGADIMKRIRELLEKTEAGKRKVRLLGITISNFADKDTKANKSMQLHLPFPNS